MSATLIIAHLLALWPIAATTTYVRRSNRAWRTHMKVLQATPLAPTLEQRTELRAAQIAHAEAESKAAIAVSAALLIMILEVIAIHLLWSAA